MGKRLFSLFVADFGVLGVSWWVWTQLPAFGVFSTDLVRGGMVGTRPVLVT